MLNYLYIIAGIMASFHSYTYGRWLHKQGNFTGYIFCVVIAAASAVVPVALMTLK